MVNRKKKGKYIGMAGALVVHVAIIALLILGRIHTAGTLGRRRCTRYAGTRCPMHWRCRPFFSKGGCHAGGNRSSGAGNGGAGHHYAGN